MVTEIILMTDINKKDERALEALLAAAFRLDFPEDISDEEAKRIFDQPAQLSPELKNACESWGTDFIDKLIKGQKTSSEKHQQDISVDQELEQDYFAMNCDFAMNRDKDGNGLDEETRRKIDEERKKALDEEEKKDKG